MVLFFVFSSFHIEVTTCTEQNINQSRANKYNSALFSSPVWFLFCLYSCRGEVSRWARSNFFRSSFYFCPPFPLQTQKTTCAVSPTPVPHVVFSPPLQVRLESIPERYNDISSITSSLMVVFFVGFFCHLYFCTQMMQTAEAQVPSADCSDSARLTGTMRSSPEDEHLLFLLCSLVSLLIGPILLFLCPCVFPPLFQFVVLLVPFLALFCLSTSSSLPLLCSSISSSIIHPKELLLKLSFFHRCCCCCFLLFPPQQDLQVSKSDLGRDAQKTRSITLISNGFFSFPWEWCFVSVSFSLVCSAAHLLLCCFCLTPGFSLAAFKKKKGKNLISHLSFIVKGMVWYFFETCIFIRPLAKRRDVEYEAPAT